MSKIRKASKARVGCPGCGSRLKARDVACRKCGKQREGGFAATGSAAKALFVPGDGAPPFLVKAARAPAARACASCRHLNKAAYSYCVNCGRPLLSVVAKSAGNAQREVFLAKVRAESNPEWREGWWRAAHPELYGRGAS